MKRHYEQILISCCFLFIFVNIGLASTAFSVHQPYLVAIEGIGDTGGSLILSARTLVSLIAMLVVDRYYSLLDVRRGVFAACLFTAIGFAIYSVAINLPTFMTGAVFLGLGYGLGGMVAMTYLANRWFSSGIGAVIGFTSMGSGIASIVMPLIVTAVISASSLSTAFRVEASIAAGVGLLVFAFLRNRPSDLDMQPFSHAVREKKRIKHGARSTGEPTTGKKSANNSQPRPIAAPVPAGQRALLMAAMVFVGIFCCCGITYLSVLATSHGFDTTFAALLVSIAGAALTVAKFVTGELFDHLGAPRASAIMFAFACVGFTLCCFVGLGNATIMICGAIAVGCGLSLGTVGISVWSIDLSDPATRTKQIKNFQVAYALGGFIANTLPGLVKDLVGTYVVSYAAMVIVAALAGGIILHFYRRFKPASQ